MARRGALFDLTGKSLVRYHNPRTALSVWSIPQFEEFAHLFSQGLAQLQYRLNLYNAGEPCRLDGAALLAFSMVGMMRAMAAFLRYRYAMAQRLEGLGRVVQTRSSKTWYAQPETSWLRKAIADIKTKCDAFSWVVAEICLAAQRAMCALVPLATSSTMDGLAPAEPLLRSYNSLSSIGSEGAREAGFARMEASSGPLAPTPSTNQTVCGSLLSTAALSTRPSSLDLTPSSSEDNNPGKSGDGSQHNVNDDDDMAAFPEYLLPTNLRELLELDPSAF